MSAVPLIEAVQRAGGAIALQGDRLRLSAAKPLPQQLLDEVRLHKTDLIDHLERTRQLEQPAPAPPPAAAASSTETIAAWAEGVARLRHMPAPRNYPERPWQQLIVDAERFVDAWAGQAAALGWRSWETFGCSRQAPFGRIDGMGLVLLLRGGELVALTDAEAVIRTAAGSRQTYHRKPLDPLQPAQRCLVWELS